MERIDLEIALNGIATEGLLHASIVTSNCFSADSFALTFAIGAPPLGNITFWSSLSSPYVEVRSNAASKLASQTLITGIIDSVVIDPLQKTVAAEGRDLSSSMIDAYRQQDFVNQTASEVAALIATQHGLNPVVTQTSGFVGRYYGDGHTRLSLGQFFRLRSDWDLVVQLARENGFDVFVQNTTFFFQPSASVADGPIRIALRDLKAIRFESTLGLGSQINARVQSWNSQNMTSYDSDYAGASSGLGTSPPSSGGARFLFSASNFTSQQVTDSAARYTAELNRLRSVLHIEMPFEFKLWPRRTILIDETDSSLDGIYRIENIERHYSTVAGSNQMIRATAI